MSNSHFNFIFTDTPTLIKRFVRLIHVSLLHTSFPWGSAISQVIWFLLMALSITSLYLSPDNRCFYKSYNSSYSIMLYLLNYKWKGKSLHCQWPSTFSYGKLIHPNIGVTWINTKTQQDHDSGVSKKKLCGGVRILNP
jgi:hypothetical protein